MSRMLVTGATGFVGSNLVRYLRDRDFEVRCLVRDKTRAKPLEKLGVQLSLGTLDDPESLTQAVAGTDTVFHLAGRIRALSSHEFTKDNVEGTRSVVEACAAQEKPPVVVYVSSIAAAGPSRSGTPVSESDTARPISDYGRSKLSAERVATALSDEVPLSIVRPPIVFGPADKASLTIFRGVKSLHLHPVPGFRRFRVSVVHVDDLCNALMRIAQHGERVAPCPNGSPNHGKGTYHVATQCSLPYGELGKLAAKALGCSALVLPLPRALFWLVGGASELVGQMIRRPAMLGVDKIREAVAPGWECSDEKLRRDLDYQTTVSLEQRFAETAAWYRAQGWL